MFIAAGIRVGSDLGVIRGLTKSPEFPEPGRSRPLKKPSGSIENGFWLSQKWLPRSGRNLKGKSWDVSVQSKLKPMVSATQSP